MEFINNWFCTIGQAVRHAITGHPTENTLIEIALSTDSGLPEGQRQSKLADAQEHISHCKHCITVLSEINATLTHINQSAHFTAHTFPELPHQRFRQRSQILRRIDTFLAPPAAVLRFPSNAPPSCIRLTPLTVCLVMVCAASPFLGVVVRQAVTSSTNQTTTVSATQNHSESVYARPTPTPIELDGLDADEQLMAEIEYAVSNSRMSPLTALDELTPRLHEAIVTVR